jgi:hypothetical protein
MPLEYRWPGPLLGPEDPEYVRRQGAQKLVERYFLFLFLLYLCAIYLVMSLITY